ncbi:MAG: ROK family transcriptional regulator [Paenibacillaceae bacterium]
MTERLSGRKAKDVYEWIRKWGTISKQEIKELSGLTTSTLTRVLEELIEAGFIIEVGLGDSTGGRPPILYQTNATSSYIFGLDISRGNTKLILCNMHLEKIDFHIWKMNERMTPEYLLQEVVLVTKHMIEKHGLNREAILGMGIGAVGPLDRKSGIIISPQNFPSSGWEHVKINAWIQEKLGIEVYLDSGANTALLGEYWRDSTDRLEHLLYVHIGVGIRSSMMVGGNLVYGAVDMEGAAGQMIIQTDGIPPRHASGNYGCWESYTSIYALEQAAISYLKQGRESTLWKKVTCAEEVTLGDLEAALQEGDSLAKEIFTQSASYFGIGLANLLNILHPQKVILGGSLITGNELFFDSAKQVAIQKTYHYPAYQVIFEKSKLGEDAVAIGAAALVIQQLTV